jgi:hypothetical protein
MAREGPSFAVLGFRPHTYWTSVVALAGDAGEPQVLDRRRIVFAAGDERGVYHHAAEVAPVEAPAWIAKVRAVTEANAAREVGGLIADLQNDGVTVRAAAVSAASAKLPQDLADILRVHSRQHAAEGNFYRDVVAQACAGLGLEVHRVVERELVALAADLLGVSQIAVQARLKAMGAALGPPWSEDYRLATLAALLHLEDAAASAAG